MAMGEGHGRSGEAGVCWLLRGGAQEAPHKKDARTENETGGKASVRTAEGRRLGLVTGARLHSPPALSAGSSTLNASMATAASRAASSKAAGVSRPALAPTRPGSAPSPPASTPAGGCGSGGSS
eukprot:scaffold25478_cov101-Isochrysis_galbana.AAC.4